jgi:crossover junction endodeoxyribonuclease RusA
MISYRVTGIPVPQGSKRHVGNGIMVEQGGQRLKSWREAVRYDTIEALAGMEPYPKGESVALEIKFLFSRPKNHYRSGKNAHLLRPTAPLQFHAQKPDIDKLLRSTLDGLKAGGAYADDCQAAIVQATKEWAPAGTAPGAYITIGRAAQ